MVNVVERRKINGNKKGRVCCQSVSMHFGKKQGNELFFQSFQSMSFLHPGFDSIDFSFLYRSRRSQAFYKRGFQKDFAKFAGKHLCRSFFFNKAAGLTLF